MCLSRGHGSGCNREFPLFQDFDSDGLDLVSHKEGGMYVSHGADHRSANSGQWAYVFSERASTVIRKRNVLAHRSTAQGLATR
jgi:hypothetical protein